MGKKYHEAQKIYRRIYKKEIEQAHELAEDLDQDLNIWLAKNETYVNPRTAQMIRQHKNRIELERKNKEKDVVLEDLDDETQAEKLVRVYKIKLRQPEPNCGP